MSLEHGQCVQPRGKVGSVRVRVEENVRRADALEELNGGLYLCLYALRAICEDREIRHLAGEHAKVVLVDLGALEA